jgi:hypothetical protein
MNKNAARKEQVNRRIFRMAWVKLRRKEKGLKSLLRIYLHHELPKAQHA